jgi:hypothetical protein
VEVAISIDQLEFFKNKKRKIEKTAFIRFNVAEGLRVSERRSIALSAILTIYLICSSVALFADGNLSSTSSGYAVSFIGIVSSISLLVVNLLDNAKGRPVMAAEMLRSGQRIMRVSSLIELELEDTDPNYELLKGYLAEYLDALDQSGLNHDSSDHEYYEKVEKLRASSSWQSIGPWIDLQKFNFFSFASSWWLHTAILTICMFGFFLLAQNAIHYFTA